MKHDYRLMSRLVVSASVGWALRSLVIPSCLDIVCHLLICVENEQWKYREKRLREWCNIVIVTITTIIIIIIIIIILRERRPWAVSNYSWSVRWLVCSGVRSGFLGHSKVTGPTVSVRSSWVMGQCVGQIAPSPVKSSRYLFFRVVSDCVRSGHRVKDLWVGSGHGSNFRLSSNCVLWSAEERLKPADKSGSDAVGWIEAFVRDPLLKFLSKFYFSRLTGISDDEALLDCNDRRQKSSDTKQKNDVGPV